MSINVDARGLACPEPVIATKKALESISEGTVTVIVDNLVAKENVVKFAVANKCGVGVEEQSGHFYINIAKGPQPAPSAEPLAPAATGEIVYLITKDTLGSGNEDLGRILMKSFMYTMVESGKTPRAMLFINSGVQLTVEGSPVLEHLKTLAGQGTQVLSCGTCLDFFQLKEKLAVGEVTNMYNILAEMSGSAKTVTL
jgi:selenium metabolism protein YedF